MLKKPETIMDQPPISGMFSLVLQMMTQIISMAESHGRRDIVRKMLAAKQLMVTMFEDAPREG